MKKYLLIDANNVGFAAQNATKLSVGGMDVQAIFGVIKTVRQMIHLHSDYEPICLWDGKSWRFDHFDAYKGNRDKDPKIAASRDSYRKQRPYIAKALRLLGVKQAIAKNMEADDLAGFIVSKLTHDGSIILATGDRDWLQLVNEHVVWSDFVRERYVNDKLFKEFTGYDSATAFVEGKALQGDVSDNVPGVGGIGEKGAADLLTTYGSVQSFWNQFDTGKIKKLPKKFKDFAENKEARKQFKLNVGLMDLVKSDIRPKAAGMQFTKQPLDRDAFERFCEEFSFASLLRDMDNWIKPYERLSKDRT